MSSYKDLAHERTVVAELQRILLDRFIASDSPPKHLLVCEEVFHNESEVSQDILVRVFESLALWEQNVRGKMGAFRWREMGDEPPPFITPQRKPPPTSPPVKKKKVRAHAESTSVAGRKKRKREVDGPQS